jgi:hypothetical protein
MEEEQSRTYTFREALVIKGMHKTYQKGVSACYLSIPLEDQLGILSGVLNELNMFPELFPDEIKQIAQAKNEREKVLAEREAQEGKLAQISSDSLID